jgi:hypothetical protein
MASMTALASAVGGTNFRKPMVWPVEDHEQNAAMQ